MANYNSSHDILREDANIEIRKFMEIREEIRDSGLANQLSPAAQSYLNSNSLSFVFYKDQLDNMFSQVEANALRVYFAADNVGKPSLVIVPCQLNSDESSSQNQQASSTGPVLQYPRAFPSGYRESDFDLAKE